MIGHPYSMWYRLQNPLSPNQNQIYLPGIISRNLALHLCLECITSRHNSCMMDVKSNNCEKSIKVQINWIQILLLKYKIHKDSHVETRPPWTARPSVEAWLRPWFCILAALIILETYLFDLSLLKTRLKDTVKMNWGSLWGGNTPKMMFKN